MSDRSQRGRPLEITDDLGDRVSLAGTPLRIVSLVPSITETLIDLGVGKRLVGRTSYCVHPREAVESIPKIGATKGVSFEKIDALSPDLIVANKEENRKRHIDRLRERYTVFVTYPRSVEGAVKTVLDLGRLVGAEARGGAIACECDELLERASAAVTGKRLRTACMIWRDPWMAVGSGTYMNDLLDVVGFRNVFEKPRYPETALEDLAAREPDVVILPDEPYAFTEADRNELASALSKRKRRPRIILMDGSYLTWFGSRTRLGLRHLLGAKARLLGAQSGV